MAEVMDYLKFIERSFMVAVLSQRQDSRDMHLPKPSHADGRAAPEAIIRYAALARNADRRATVDVTEMSDDEILKLIRR